MRCYRFLLIALFAFSSLALCGEVSSKNSDNPRASIKTRAVSEEQRAETFARRERGGQGEEVSQKKATSSQKLGSSKVGKHQEKESAWGYVYDLSSYPGLHMAVTVGINGEIVEIEDGSVFSVRKWDQWTVAHWLPGSWVYVTPNHGYFFGLIGGNHDLCLVNAQTLETVEVDLSMGPYLYGENSTWIVDIDEYQGIIALSDGSYVQVDPSDRGIMWSWLLGEHLIVGSNDGSHHYKYPNILVNVASVDYIRVRYL